MYCLACCKDLEDTQDSVPVMFLYQAPGDTKQEVVAYLCVGCGDEATENNKYNVLEAIVNARIARVRNPDKNYKPGPRD